MSGQFKLINRILALCLIVTQIVLPLQASAGISQLPPLVKPNVPPNVFYTLDDSGSMMFEMMPENLLPYGDGRDINGGLAGRSWTTTDIANYCDPRWNSTYCSVRYVFPPPTGVYSTSGYSGRGGVTTVFFNDNITVARWRSARLNKAYYDPTTRYLPWIDPDQITVENPYGLPMANADVTAAQYNPMKAVGQNMDLTGDMTETGWWLSDDALSASKEARTYFPATYYIYSPRATLNNSYPACTGGNVSESNLNCFTRIEIRRNAGTFTPARYARANTRTDCKTTYSGQLVCSYDEELQNFANWFQYYRSRVLMARASSAAAFATQPTTLRVGFGTINTNNTVVRRISDDFSMDNKKGFLKDLYQQPIKPNGTPLIKSVDEIGQYFSNNLPGLNGVNSPWQTRFGAKADPIACRQSYNILMTDGYWSPDDSAAAQPGNWDGLDGPVIDNTTYRYHGEKPYADAAHSDTLADIAFYYWSRDLTTMENIVPLPKDGSDIANWQHLVQFTVGLGVEGSLNPKTDLPALTSGAKVWPDPTTNDAHKIDDLWHAAVNSRGRFFSASNPTEFSDALRQSLNDIASRSGDAAAIATSNNTLGSNLKMYTATYRTGDWSGRLEQKSIFYNAADPTDPANGNVQPGSDWDTDFLSPIAANRNIVTTSSAGNGGVNFVFDNLSSSQKDLLNTAAATFTASTPVNGADIVNYIRGDKSREGDPFRSRTYWLGDLVNSDPQYLKAGRDDGYSFLPAGAFGKSQYKAFKNRSRAATVFVGSNDGMLHAFDATGSYDPSGTHANRGTGGDERFAFIPSAVIANLPELAKPTYIHRFFVDGTSFIGDAAIGDTSDPWRTVLLGATGAGAKSVFALDVTDSASFTKDKVLWEKTAVGDSDLGYTIGVPQIGRMKDGRWVAVFGNGFSSVNGVAVLYVLNLKTGDLIAKVSTGAGSPGSPNGLSTPKLLVGPDANIVAAYAGDVAGNLWKFDFVTSGADTVPAVGISGSPLFVATDAVNGSGRKQPITTQPQIYPHPQGGYMIVFGTGKIFEDTDAATTDVETLYGIWDKTVSTSVPKSKLVEQMLSIVNTNFYGVTRNVIDWDNKRGWFLSLNKSAGERLITDPNLFEDQAIFTTLIPGSGSNACSSDGRSATIQISPLNGAALGYKTIDENRDGVVNSSDAMVSGRLGDATFGTTIVRTGNRNVKQFQAASKNGTVASNTGKSSDLIPTARLWRQLLGRP